MCGGTVTPDSTRKRGEDPARLVSSSTVSTIAASRVCSIGWASSAIARRDSSSARSAAAARYLTSTAFGLAMSHYVLRLI